MIEYRFLHKEQLADWIEQLAENPGPAVRTAADRQFQNGFEHGMKRAASILRDSLLEQPDAG